MKQTDKIEQDICKTLDQFDQADPLAPNPYFYTRIQARLQAKRQKKNAFSALLKPALLIALVAANLGTAVWYMGGNGQIKQINPRQELIEMLADDLELNNSQPTLLLTGE